MNKLLLLFFLFSLTSQADFKVKNDEMHKKGLIIIEQPGVPLGPRYFQLLWIKLEPLVDDQATFSIPSTKFSQENFCL